MAGTGSRETFERTGGWTAFFGGVRSHPAVVVAIALVAICVLVGLATGFWLLFRLAYVVGLAVPLIYLWSRAMVRGLEVEVFRRTHRVSQGQPLEGRVVIRSTSFWPKVWLEVEDQASVPGHRSKRIVTLGPNGVDAWSYRTPTRRRGLYELGPVTVTARDPFGFFRISRSFGQLDTVLVYPSAPELPNFYIPPANLPGEGRFRRRTHNVTPNVAGIRGYEPGDSFNRIHWRSTARTGELMVKLFELDPASDIWLVVDLEQGVHHALKDDDNTEEAAVSIAASIGRYFINANRSIGLIEFGDDLRVDEPDRGSNQFTRVLESLALARASGDITVSQLLTEESRRFGRHTTVVVITPSTNEEWPLTMMALQGRGVKVAAVLLEAETWGAETSSLGVYGSLAAGGIYTYTVKRSDDLARVLGAGSEVPDRRSDQSGSRGSSGGRSGETSG
ncbi:MAG: DUF58 domain-containing protein [Dehalococcoidia bacterium]|jgi:uncharacterized protein (DUF58 family)|nr:DUF58 domain-containing protein [Dehalococcoidia bacterium]